MGIGAGLVVIELVVGEESGNGGRGLVGKATFLVGGGMKGEGTTVEHAL